MAFRNNNHEKRAPVQLAHARHLDTGNAKRCIQDTNQFCVPTADCVGCPNSGIRSTDTNTLISADAIRTLNLR